jgi:tetratricopeptide (TPR) repeat protein
VREGGAVKLTRPVSELRIPATVQGILAARIDRLAPDTKELLQTLSVIGREFPMSLIRAVVPKSDDELNRMLSNLQLAEFVYEQPAVGDSQYIFKHALTQEVSHNSVLLDRRRQLHERIGGAIETVFAANLEDHLAELAHHYSRSANRAKALEFLHRAGEQAFNRASYSEAESYLAAALEAVSAISDSAERDAPELRVRSSFVPTLAVTKGWNAPEVLEMISRARALAKKTGNLRELVQQLYLAAIHANSKGDYFSAAELADQALEAAHREGSPIGLGLAHSTSLVTRFYLGDFVGAEEHFARGRAFCEAPDFLQNRPMAVVTTLINGSWNAWITGHADAARERVELMRRVLEVARRNPYVTATARALTADLYTLLREFGRAEGLAGEALASAEEHGFPDVAIWARVPLGLARAELGHTAEGVVLIRQALAAATESGSRFRMSLMLTYLAEAEALDGALADALRTIDDALEANPQELFRRPETLRVRGELRLRQGDRGLSEADFREAISLAQKMSAKGWELRAATSLARLLRDNNRRDEAHTMFAEMYNWFTEGFDTADLKDAKALLDELSD